MAKFCGTCGAQMDDNAAFCPNCGGQSAVAAETNQQNVGQVEPPVPPVYNAEPTYGNQPMPGYGQMIPPQQKPSVGLAVASMVCGIVSLVFSCCIPVVTYIVALVGLILGGVSLSQKKGGKGMAIAGLVCSIIALVPAVIVTIVGASTLASLGGLESYMSGF